MVTYTIISRYDELGDLDSLNTDLEKPELIIITLNIKKMEE